MREVIIRDEHGSTGLLRITYDGIRGEGRIQPTIIIVAKMATLVKEDTVRPFQMATKLQLEGETVGHGDLRGMGKLINMYSTQAEFELLTSQRALNFVYERFRQDYLDFGLFFDCLLNFTREGQPSEIVKPQTTALGFRISKHDWLKQVLEPMKYADFALLEFPVPEIPARQQWETILQHIEEAEKQYRNGNDPGTFSYCYAAYEAIKPIENRLSHVENEDKRSAVNSMLKDIRRFFNEGRHVEKGGVDAGKFPVDHRDAEFALCLVKSSVAYLAKLAHKAEI